MSRRWSRLTRFCCTATSATLICFSLAGCPAGSANAEGTDSPVNETDNTLPADDRAGPGRGPDDSADGGTSDVDGDGLALDEGDPDRFPGAFDLRCGSRTVTTVPSSVFVSVSGSHTTSIEPPNSKLIAALYGGLSCDLDSAASSSTFYEVGPSGELLRTCYTFGGLTSCVDVTISGRFVIEDGCLELRYDSDEYDSDAFDLADFDPEEFEHECPDGGVPLHQRPLTGRGDSPFICLEYKVLEFCRDCSYADGRWTSRLTIAVQYTARDDLLGIAVSPNDCVPDGAIDVHAGDSAVMRITQTDVYEIQPAPATTP